LSLYSKPSSDPRSELSDPATSERAATAKARRSDGPKKAASKPPAEPKVLPIAFSDDEAAAIYARAELSGEPVTSDEAKRLGTEWSPLVNKIQEGNEKGLARARATIAKRSGGRLGEIDAAISRARSARDAAPTEGGIVGSVGASTPVSPQFEGEPRALDIDLLPVIQLDLELLPMPLRAWVVDIAERGGFPVEFVVTSFLVSLSSLIARRLAIRPKRFDPAWLVIVNLWGMLIARAGLTKTPSTQDALSPLHRLDARERDRYQDAIKQNDILGNVEKAMKEARNKALTKAAAKGENRERLIEIASSGQEEQDVEAPSLRRYIINDPSIEKLGEILRESPSCPLFFRDEIDGLFRTFEREGHESDRKFYLECWDGNGSYTFDRIGRGTVHIKSLCLAFLGTIQPGPLARFLKGTLNGTEADGFINRFQCSVYPDVKEYVHVDRPANVEARNDANAVFDWLNRLDPQMLGADFDEAKGMHYLRFDDEAQAIFDEWLVRTKRRCQGGAESAIMASHLSKFPSLMPSIALLHHVIESMGDRKLKPVTARSAKAAIRWCEFFESHTRRIYQAASEGDPTLAAALLERLKKTLPNPFTPREVAIKGWSGMTKVDDVRKVLGLLEDRNVVKPEIVAAKPGSQGGAPSEKYWIHPSIRPPEPTT
jgi:Protein of unknown function (DUF3987)